MWFDISISNSLILRIPNKAYVLYYLADGREELIKVECFKIYSNKRGCNFTYLFTNLILYINR